MSIEERLDTFVRSLYFDIQRIDGVNPLEIWNGIREFDDPYEKTSLIKNLFKIVIPLVNEELYGRPFSEHSALVKKAVAKLIMTVRADAGSRITGRFPDPPTMDSERKELYTEVREEAGSIVKPLAAAMRRERRAAKGRTARETGRDAKGKTGRSAKGKKGLPVEMSIGTIFDFREMRIIDNELPYIIFTDKEYRVIHGLAVVYLWLIDLDSLFVSTLEDNGVDVGIVDGYRSLVRKVQKENPLTIQGREMNPSELMTLIREKMKGADYLDVFEDADKWFDAVREKLLPKG